MIYLFHMKQHKNLTIHEYELPITVEQEKKTGGFIVQCQNWQDCYAQGDTLEEAVNEISYVASSLIELYQEENMPVPLKLKRTKRHTLPTLQFNIPLLVTGQ